GQQFADYDWRTRKRLEHAILPTLNALGNFHFAFACEQRNSSHLAQVHADGIIGLFQSTRREVKFYVLAGFFIFSVESGGGHFRALEYIYALRTDCGQQIFEVVGTLHILRYEVIDLVIREISLFFPRIDQLFYIVVFIVESQDGFSSSSLRWMGPPSGGTKVRCFF